MRICDFIFFVIGFFLISFFNFNNFRIPKKKSYKRSLSLNFFLLKEALMMSNQIGIKWFKIPETDQYFQKVAPNKWFEYQNSIQYAEFTEISFQNQIVILKRHDGNFVKLTDTKAYWGNSQNEISHHFTDGKWERKEAISVISNNLPSRKDIYNIDYNIKYP